MIPIQKRHFIYVLFLWASLLGAAGCSTLGYENVDTTRKAILVANAELAAANSLLRDLIDRRAISSAAAEDAHLELQAAHDHLQTALSAVDQAGDPVTAGNNLERAKTAISFVMALLAPLVET
jgi:hypothetical protein